MRLVKCQYCGEKNEASNMMLHLHKPNKVTYKHYYHEECFELKQSRDQTIELFYKYTKSLEPKNRVYAILKQLKDTGVNDHEILYIMKYIIDGQHILNYAAGIKFYASNAVKEYRSKKKFAEKQYLNQTKDDSVGIVTEETKLPVSNCKKDDELDISGFL